MHPNAAARLDDGFGFSVSHRRTQGDWLERAYVEDDTLADHSLRSSSCCIVAARRANSTSFFCVSR